VDEAVRIRVDDYEMRPDVQKEVGGMWTAVTTANANQFGGVDSYNKEFLRLFGFGLNGVDYNADLEIDIKIDQC
jgi:enoyl-[acyl-carrier protein] reductase/trans-2-enoyl-CoA reductase (NAD+)